MGGFNLPPGVSVSDIPGNRPEDVAEEEFWEKLHEKLTAEGYRQADIDDIFENDFTMKAMMVAREMGYTRGYNEGQAEAEMAQGMLEGEIAEIMHHWLEDHPQAFAKQYLRRAAQARQDLTRKD